MSEMTKEKEKILVYEPVAEAPGASAVMAARPESLSGKSVGLINNTKDFTDEISTSWAPRSKNSSPACASCATERNP